MSINKTGIRRKEENMYLRRLPIEYTRGVTFPYDTQMGQHGNDMPCASAPCMLKLIYTEKADPAR